MSKMEPVRFQNRRHETGVPQGMALRLASGPPAGRRSIDREPSTSDFPPIPCSCSARYRNHARGSGRGLASMEADGQKLKPQVEFQLQAIGFLAD
jgi:hypothetical protein